MTQQPTIAQPRSPQSQSSAFVTTLNRKHKSFSQAGHLSSIPACALEIAILGAIQSLTTSGLVCIWFQGKGQAKREIPQGTPPPSSQFIFKAVSKDENKMV